MHQVLPGGSLHGSSPGRSSHRVSFSPEVIHTGPRRPGTRSRSVISIQRHHRADPRRVVLLERRAHDDDLVLGSPVAVGAGDFPMRSPIRARPKSLGGADDAEPVDGVSSYTTVPRVVRLWVLHQLHESAAGTDGVTELADPSNPPWNTSGSVEPDSQVSVHSDPRFGTPDMSWGAPNRGVHGALSDVSYADPRSTNPVGSHPLAISLPPGYNPHRACRLRRCPEPRRWRQQGRLDHAGSRTASSTT